MALFNSSKKFFPWTSFFTSKTSFVWSSVRIWNLTTPTIINKCKLNTLKTHFYHAHYLIQFAQHLILHADIAAIICFWVTFFIADDKNYTYLVWIYGMIIIIRFFKGFTCTVYTRTLQHAKYYLQVNKKHDYYFKTIDYQFLVYPLCPYLHQLVDL